MTNHLQRDLRAAFDRLGAEPAPPPGVLAGNARRKAARTRTAQFAASAAALALVVTGGYAGVRAVGAAPNTGTPVGTAGPTGTGTPAAALHRAVAALSTPGLVDAHDRPVPPHSLVRDPATGALRDVPYDTVTPAPDGQRAAVADAQGRLGVLDLRTNRVRWVAGFRGTASWSPDSTRILITGGPSGLSQQASTLPANNGFVIVDAASLHVAFTPIPDVPNTLGADGVWLDARHIGVSVGSDGTPTGIRVYDLGGHVVRTLPATGVLRSEASISPSGAYFALTESLQESPFRGLLTVVDAHTGAVVSSRPVLRTAGFVGWYDDRHLVLLDHGRSGGPQLLLVTDLAGNTVRQVLLQPRLDGAYWTAIVLGTARTGGF